MGTFGPFPRLERRFFWGALVLAVLGAGPLAEVQAQALGIFPTRVVFEGRQRSAQVTLINNATTERTFRIFFKNLRMSDNGAYEEVNEALSGELFAANMIRYSPRQISIPGSSSQSVRLLVRKPRDLPSGEYRSHLFFQTVPPPDTGTSVEEQSDLQPGEVSVSLQVIFAISIPIIVRHGELSVDATISDVNVDPGRTPESPDLVAFRINRQGDRSVYGDIAVTFETADGAEIEVAHLNGVAVLSPNASRIIRLRLVTPDGQKVKNGNLQVSYRQKADQGGELLAEAEIAIP